MEEDHSEFSIPIGNPSYTVNITCDYDYVPPADEYIESLGAFGIVFVSLGTILMAATLYLSVDASYAVILTKESKSLKRNILLIFSVYPVASLCSLLALAIPRFPNIILGHLTIRFGAVKEMLRVDNVYKHLPAMILFFGYYVTKRNFLKWRAQLLSEAVTQIFLTIALYRLYLLLIDVGLRDVKKSPPLMLRVGPCCCWPCLPFPDLEMNPTNLSWVQIIVLQLPIVQTLIYSIFAFMAVENPLIASRYGVFLQPLSITSILLGLYGLSITVMTLREVNPDSNLRRKAAVVQMVLLFSKLQGFIIKSLAGTGLFPCNPPITPQVYANFTYNALMLIEMLFLCYAAKLVYGDDGDANCVGHCSGFAGVAETPVNNSLDNVVADDVSRDDAKTTTGIRIELDRHNHITNNNEVSTTTGQNLPMNIRLASVTA